jgi:SNF2 family DNA or RNA helicase
VVTDVAKNAGKNTLKQVAKCIFFPSRKLLLIIRICPLCRAPVRSISSLEGAIADKKADKFADAEFKTSSKLNKVLELIDEEENHKFVIVSQWRELLRLVADALSQNKVSYMQLDGSTVPEKRGEMVKQFQNNQNIRVCLLSLHAAAEGITLTEADRVVHLGTSENVNSTY